MPRVTTAQTHRPSNDMSTLRRRLAAGVLVAAVAWTGWAFAGEMRRAFAPLPPGDPAAPYQWTLRSERVAELRGFLDAADGVLPEGSLVAVASGTAPPQQDFFFYLWAAYLLPRHDVVRLSQRWTWGRADYLVVHRLPRRPGAWRTLLGEPMGGDLKVEPEPLLDHPDGVVYRVRRP